MGSKKNPRLERNGVAAAQPAELFLLQYPQQLGLQRHQLAQVVGPQPPAGLDALAEHAGVAARHVHQRRVERPGRRVAGQKHRLDRRDPQALTQRCHRRQPTTVHVAVGEATGDDRVVGFAPDNCSVTIVDVEDGSFRLVERGAEAATRVL